MESGNYQFKVVLLGEGCVGKTSLMLRYVQDQFNEKHLSTTQAAFLRKKIKIGNRTIELAIWDTAGQEKYHALGPIYYRGSNGAFLVYDITDVDSFKRIKNWVKELKSALGDECVLCIVGNKADLEKDRQIPLDEAEEYSRSVGAKHYSTSAKNNQGVTELFLSISKSMLDKALVEERNGSAENRSETTTNKNRRNVVQVVDDGAANSTAQKKSCC